MMMKNNKVTTSTKTTNKQKHHLVRREKGVSCSSSPRSPLKVRNFNTVSSSSLSSSTVSSCSTTSSFASSSKSSYDGCYKEKVSVGKVSKSAPNDRVIRNGVMKKNEKQKPTWNMGQNVRKIPPRDARSDLSGKNSSGSLLNLRNNENLSSGSVLKLRNNEKSSSGSVLKLRNNEKVRKNEKVSSGSVLKVRNFGKYESESEMNVRKNERSLSGSVLKLRSSDKVSSGCKSKPVLRSGEVDLNLDLDLTPVNKLGCQNAEAVEVEEGKESNTPPVQISESPEIQGGSTLMVLGTPATCYAAGHLLSGVTDKRKCKPRGILTIGDNDLFGSSKGKVFDSRDESVVVSVKSGRVSIVPAPGEASVHWLSSPSKEKLGECQEDEDENGSGLRLEKCGMVVPFKSSGSSSSALSSLGFSSEMFNKTSCTITTSDATTATCSSSSRSSLLSPDSASEFRGLLGPSFDYFVRSPQHSSLASLPSCKMEVGNLPQHEYIWSDHAGRGNTPEHDNTLSDHVRGFTPNSEDSAGSGNVICTPRTNSNSPKVGSTRLSGDDLSRLWFDGEFDSLTEFSTRASLSPDCQMPINNSQQTSFEFNPLVESTSPDIALFQRVESMVQGLPESEVDRSWREGLTNHSFEMDELDCCRCVTDDEEDGCDDLLFSGVNQELGADGSIEVENLVNENDKRDPFLASTSKDRGRTIVPEDSS